MTHDVREDLWMFITSFPLNSDDLYVGLIGPSGISHEGILECVLFSIFRDG